MYDVVQGKKIPGQEKKRWVKMGIAFVQDGKISGIKLDALPIPDEKGEVWLSLFEKKPREEMNREMDRLGTFNNKEQKNAYEELDDEIPI